MLKIKAKIEEKVESAKEFVKEHPYSITMGALAIGSLLSYGFSCYFGGQTKGYLKGYEDGKEAGSEAAIVGVCSFIHDNEPNLAQDFLKMLDCKGNDFNNYVSKTIDLA